MRGIQVDSQRFRQLRRARGLSQRELAEQAGVGERTVRNAETGRRVRLDFLNYLATALKCDVLDLVDDRDELRLGLREQRRVEHILEAISEHVAHDDRRAYLDLLAENVHIACHGPEGLAICGNYRGRVGAQTLLDVSSATLTYDRQPDVFEIRTGGNLVVIHGRDYLTAIPTGKSFTIPWMNVYEFDNGHIARLDQWTDISIVEKAFQPG